MTFAYEIQMEKIAAELGIDPLELRRINMLREGDITATGQRLTWSVGSEDVLNAAVERSGLLEKRARNRAKQPRSRQTAGHRTFIFFHGAGFTGSGEAKMKAQAGVEITAGRPRARPLRLDRDRTRDSHDLLSDSR